LTVAANPVKIYWTFDQQASRKALLFLTRAAVAEVNLSSQFKLFHDKKIFYLYQVSQFQFSLFKYDYCLS